MVEYPFQPTINQKSVEITNKKEQIANVVDRLISEYKSKELKISKLREKYDQEVQKELTFHPNVNNYIPIQPDYQIKKTTIEQYTFQPSINPLSVLMTQERQYETD
jgi:chromosome segregation ATPase